MSSICNMCVMGEACPHFGKYDEEHFERCDERLAGAVEKGRYEYRKAWMEYIKEYCD